MQNEIWEDWNIERRSLTSRIDRLRGSVSEQTIKNTEERYNTICSITTIDELKWEIQRCFPENKHKVIREFFIEHPVCWSDIQRKIHALKKYDNERKRWYIEDDKLGEIYASFLIRGRRNDVWEKIRTLLPDTISENQDLIIFAWAQPSLLDEGWFMFSHISAKNRKWHIRKLISYGMISNIDNCTYDDLDKHIPIILPKLLRYIKEILGKSIHLSYCKTLDDIVKALDKMMASWHGEQRENAFRIIQSFHAWSSIEDIERFHNLAQEKIEYIPKKLKEIWITINGGGEKIEHNDAIIHKAEVIFQWKHYHIEWRVKTVKSILQKMWETEEYTNKDAIRDMLWIFFIWPDSTTPEEKRSIITKFGILMQDFWYLLKDKWWLGDEIHDIQKSLSDHKKNPVHISRKVKNSTNPEFMNTSISGFMSISGTILGTEIQFSNESSALWKKKDDKIYKPKWMFKVIMRGTKFATPKECYDIINERIKAGNLKELGYNDINTMILAYIEKEKFLIPYVSENAKELLITHVGREEEFKEKFPDMERCTLESPLYHNVVRYISGVR
jgi:hypothetical protein